MIKDLGAVLGLFEDIEQDNLDAEVEALIEARNAARAAKDIEFAQYR